MAEGKIFNSIKEFLRQKMVRIAIMYMRLNFLFFIKFIMFKTK